MSRRDLLEKSGDSSFATEINAAKDALVAGNFELSRKISQPLLTEVTSPKIQIIVLNIFGISQLALKHFESAQDAFTLCLELGGDAADFIPLISESLSGQKQFSEALDLLDSLGHLPDQQARALFHKGKVHEAAGDFPEAIAFYKKAAESGGLDEKAHLHQRMGEAFYQLGLYEESRENFSISLKHDENPFVMIQMSHACRRNDNLESALSFASRALAAMNSVEALNAFVDASIAVGEYSAAYQKMLEMEDYHGGTARYHRKLSELLMYMGAWQDALAENISALDFLIQDWGSLTFSDSVELRKRPLRGGMSGNLALQALRDIKQLFDGAGIEFFLAFGTLLGCIRDRDFIGHDKDVDLGLSFFVDRERVRRLLESSGRYKLLKAVDFGENQPEGESWIVSYRHVPTNIVIDLSFFLSSGDVAYAGFCRKPYEFLYAFPSFSLRPALFLGDEYLIPDNSEQHLQALYGDSWSKPQPDFDTLISAKNLTEKSSVISLTYGYGRLFDSLLTGDLLKSLWYSDELIQREQNLKSTTTLRCVRENLRRINSIT